MKMMEVLVAPHRFQRLEVRLVRAGAVEELAAVELEAEGDRVLLDADDLPRKTRWCGRPMSWDSRKLGLPSLLI